MDCASAATALIPILNITNPFTQEQVKEGFQRWPKTLKAATKRTASFAKLKDTLKNQSEKEVLTPFNTLSELTKTLDPLLRESTDVEKEGYSQVCFQGNPWSSLNSIPFALLFLSIYKSYIVPAFGVLIPLISWILPYVFIKAFYNIPISFSEYTKILWRMWNGQAMPKSPQDLLSPPPAGPTDIFSQMKQLAQTGWTLFTLGQAMWQPIQQARHFMRLDVDCIKLGESVLSVKGVALELWGKWSTWLPSWLGDWIHLCPSTAREAFAFSLDTPFWIQYVLRAVGRLEVLLKLALRADIIPAQFVRSKTPLIVLKGTGDPSIPMESRVVSSVSLGGTGGAGSPRHAILTGPNRGGKSSFLRAVLMNVQLAHCFGAAFAEKAQFSHFSWIANGMSLEDTPGETSMFEREVAFASGVLQKKDSDGFGLLLYDELFHSTNPPDATRTSQMFCSKLWAKKNVLSIVSTHVYSLAKEAPENLVKKLCVAAWKPFHFSYTIQRGVCEVSSVDLVLKQYGL
jgi:hypothetical protein